MYLGIKNWKKIILSVCTLIMMMSITVFAENSEETKVSLNEYELVLDIKESELVYTGEEIKPAVAVVKKDESGTVIETLNPEYDYSVSYADNTNAGVASVTVTGAGNYQDSLTKTFEIKKASLKNAEVSLKYETTTYSGSAKTPKVTSVILDGKTLKSTDYKVKYSNNVDAGKAKVTVSGAWNYQDSLTKTFEIKKASLKNAKVSLSYNTATYSGSKKTPKVTSVTLDGKTLESTDYKVKYSNNVNAGKAKVTVTGKGNYTDSKDVTFKINTKKMDIDFTRAYKKVTIKWSKVSKADGYMIYRKAADEKEYVRIATKKSADITSCVAINLEYNKKYYFKVKAYNKVDGKIVFNATTPANSVKVRVAKTKIDGIKRISPTSLNVRWDTVEGATGYRLYRSTSKNGEYKTVATLKGNNATSYTDTGLVCGKTYYYTVKAFKEVEKVKLAGDLSNVRKQYTRPLSPELTDDCYYKGTKASLEWKKVDYADGYVIYRATSKNGTYKAVKTITSQNTLNWTNTGLSKTKAYYYKIRAYCNENGKKVYSAYSNAFKKRTAEWRYSTFQGEKIKYYYNADNEKVKDVSNLIGKQDSYVIKVNKRKATVTIYAKDGKNGYIIPVKAMRCSPGWNTPEGTFYTPKKYRWKELMGPCWGQWSTRISGSFLFHSVFYNSYHNSDTLSVNGYNNLGTVCSHGCVRLTAGDAKWIYDNCKLGTKVIIYNSSVSGPLGKPSTYKLPYWHTWDPTDPNKFAKCDAYGCH